MAVFFLLSSSHIRREAKLSNWLAVLRWLIEHWRLWPEWLVRRLVVWCVKGLKCIQIRTSQHTSVLLARFAPFLRSVDETPATFNRHWSGYWSTLNGRALRRKVAQVKGLLNRPCVCESSVLIVCFDCQRKLLNILYKAVKWALHFEDASPNRCILIRSHWQTYKITLTMIMHGVRRSWLLRDYPWSPQSWSGCAYGPKTSFYFVLSTETSSALPVGVFIRTDFF